MIRILYSFPTPLGTGRIADTAWYQVKGVSDWGGSVDVFTSSNHKALPSTVRVHPTLSRGRFRVPLKILGRQRAFAIHDKLVARWIRKHAGTIDLIHTWPLGSLETLKTARQLGIPTVLERPNAHTRYAYDVVSKECERLGVVLPKRHEHAYNPEVLRIEEQEYALADHLLCPSDFVVRTFLDLGFAPEKLVRHTYGYDPARYYPNPERRESEGLRMLFVGVCAVRKGLHFALEAWLRSTASRKGRFQIAGAFVPAYAEKLAPMLAHPSVEVLGHRNDIPELMRDNDVLVLPSIEEGSALVTSDARGSGCVLLVSEASGAICTHMENALVHAVGNIDQLTGHITLLDQDRALLQRLRTDSLQTVHEITWSASGRRLLDIYRRIASSRTNALSAGCLVPSSPAAV